MNNLILIMIIILILDLVNNNLIMNCSKILLTYGRAIINLDFKE